MPQFLEGTVIADRFVLGPLLGGGRMGVVQLAYDRHLDRNVALKMMRPSWDAEPDEVLRFQREAIALASIRSRNVVAFHSFGRSRQTCYYAMDYVEGATIEQLVARESAPLSLDFVLSTLRDVSCGLAHVHHAGFVHRDVRPSNILIEERTGRAVLFDFGQVLAGGVEEIGPWTDEYALACTGFEMLAGHHPFDGDCVGKLLRTHMLSRPPTLSTFRPDLAALDAVFVRALANAPAERYVSASAMVDALATALRPRDMWTHARTLLPGSFGDQP